MSKRLLAATMTCLLGAPIACGGLGDADQTPPLAVIEGRLDQTSAAPASTPERVRVAVIWVTTDDFKKSVDIEAEAVFPSKFRIELKNPPPASAMLGGDGGETTAEPSAPSGPNTDETVDDAPKTTTQNFGASWTRWAIGTIVAYEDTNGNGQLDLLNADQPPIDRILGTNKEMVLFYFEGEPLSPLNRETIGSPTRGYTFLHAPACEAPRKNHPAEPCHPAEWLPITTLYELSLSADPELAEMMCGSTSSSSSSEATKSNVKPGDPLPPAPGPNGWPAKDDANLFCADDGKSYGYSNCVSTSLGLCRGTNESCSYDWYSLPAGGVPAEWPCTVK